MFQGYGSNYTVTPGSTITAYGTGNQLSTNGDISGDTISGIQKLDTTSVTLTASEFAGFSSLYDYDSNLGPLVIEAASAGTYNLAALNTANSFNMTALSSGGTTLTGNNEGGTLTAPAPPATIRSTRGMDSRR